MGDFAPCPWNLSGKLYPNHPDGLHQEIIDLFHYLCPSKVECFSRAEIIRKVELIVKRLFPKSELVLHGSYKSGLYLPTSDIDMSILDSQLAKPEQKVNALERLAHLIVEEKIALKHNVSVIVIQPVPVIRFIDRVTSYKVDISINTKNCKKSALLIDSYIRKFPPFPFLVMVLKQFLFLHDLHEVYYKGISSYCLVLMVVSFLQLHYPAVDWKRDRVNFGVMLLEFFELYGKRFDTSKCAIKVADGGEYEKKYNSCDGHKLSILDPLDYSNDVGKATFAYVKCAFSTAFHTLSRRFCFISRKPTERSILLDIISVGEDVQAYRAYIHREYSMLVVKYADDEKMRSFASPCFANYEKNYDPYAEDESSHRGDIKKSTKRK